MLLRRNARWWNLHKKHSHQPSEQSNHRDLPVLLHGNWGILSLQRSLHVFFKCMELLGHIFFCVRSRYHHHWLAERLGECPEASLCFCYPHHLAQNPLLPETVQKCWIFDKHDHAGILRYETILLNPCYVNLRFQQFLLHFSNGRARWEQTVYHKLSRRHHVDI